MSIPKPTAAELEQLQTLWPLGAATAKQVHEAMLAEKPDLAYGTVLRLMQKASPARPRHWCWPRCAAASRKKNAPKSNRC